MVVGGKSLDITMTVDDTYRLAVFPTPTCMSLRWINAVDDFVDAMFVSIPKKARGNAAARAGFERMWRGRGCLGQS